MKTSKFKKISYLITVLFAVIILAGCASTKSAVPEEVISEIDLTHGKDVIGIAKFGGLNKDPKITAELIGINLFQGNLRGGNYFTIHFDITFYDDNIAENVKSSILRVQISEGYVISPRGNRRQPVNYLWYMDKDNNNFFVLLVERPDNSDLSDLKYVINNKVILFK